MDLQNMYELMKRNGMCRLEKHGLHAWINKVNSQINILNQILKDELKNMYLVFRLKAKSEQL